MSQFLRYNNDYKSVIFDTETTGLNLFYTIPWQLSYLICKGPKIEKTVNKYLWWPNLKLSEDAARITRFNYLEYKEKAEDPKKVYEEFADYLYSTNYLNIGQNSLGYDIYILNTLRRLLGMKPDWSFLHRSYDTACLGKFLIYTAPPQIQDNKLLWQFQLRNSWEKGKKASLSALGKYFDIEVDEENRHDALVDIKLTFEVFKKEIWKIEI